MEHGADFVRKLNGIFAFAIWDGRKHKLYLFRDRLGVKPCFYAKRGQGILFSSEIKGILCYPGMAVSSQFSSCREARIIIRMGLSAQCAGA